MLQKSSTQQIHSVCKPFDTYIIQQHISSIITVSGKTITDPHPSGDFTAVLR